MVEKFHFDNTDIELAERVDDLGVIFDNSLSLTYHIYKICKKGTNAISSIGRIRKHLTKAENLQLLVHALVISRLDYSVKYYLLTVFQNRNLRNYKEFKTLPHTITGINQHEHITPSLQKLHWSPHGLSPTDLSSLQREYQPPRTLPHPPNRFLLFLQWIPRPTVPLCTYIMECPSYCSKKCCFGFVF